MKRLLALCLLAALLPLCATAEILENPAVPAQDGLISHPEITQENAIYRLFPRYYQEPGKLSSMEEYARLIDQFNVTYDIKDYQIAGWYEPGTKLHPYTYCNYFAADVSQAMGAFLPGGINCCPECGRPRPQEFIAWYRTEEGCAKIEAKDNPLYCFLSDKGLICEDCTCASLDPVYLHLTSDPAASLVVWLDEHGASFGWRKVESSDTSLQAAAQKNADAGLLTVGVRADSYAGHIIVIYPNIENRAYAASYLSEAGANLRNYSSNYYSGYAYYTNFGLE